MSRLRHWARVIGWRSRMLIPQGMQKIWSWAMDAAVMAGNERVETSWTGTPLPFIEPDKEGAAIRTNVRSGITTHSEALRERGFIPEEFWEEYQSDLEELDKRGLVLDSDPRRMTQQGQAQQTQDGEPSNPDPPS